MENRKYELQRSRFYRDLGGEEKTLFDIEEDKVKNFGAKCGTP